MPTQWSLIRDLDTSRSNFAIKLRLVRGYGSSYYNQRDVSWECVFHDSEGDRIEATIPRPLIPTFKPQLEEGLIYGIRNFKVTHNTKKFKVTTNRYKFTFEENTLIYQAIDRDFPNQRFCLKSFEEVKQMDNIYDGSLFDVIGVMQPGKVQYKTGADGTEKKLIEITIEDIEGRRLFCTLWENYVHELLALLEQQNQPINISLVQFCKTSFYRGEVRVGNVFNVTKLLVNADIPEITDFRQRLLTESIVSPTTDCSISQGTLCSLSDENYGGTEKLKTIEELFDDDESGYCWLAGTIDSIDLSAGWMYISCKICAKKLVKVEQKFLCEKCNKYDSSATLRYRIKVLVKDETGKAPFLLWDRECMQAIGQAAAELKKDAEGEDVDQFPKEIQIALLDKKFMFKIQPKSIQSSPFTGGYNVSKISTDPTIIPIYSYSCLDSQESNFISNGDESKAMKDKAEDVALMETPSSKGVGEEWSDDGAIKRSLDDAFSATGHEKKRKVYIKKEKD